MNLKPGRELRIFRPVAAGADYVAVVGDNRKMVVFPLPELPEMARGSGVQLQRYRDGGLSDAAAIRFADGLSWAMGGDSGRTRTEADLDPVADRARRRRADGAERLSRATTASRPPRRSPHLRRMENRAKAKINPASYR